MILVGNQRGNSKDMADHLLRDDNETVIVHEVSGFISDDLHSAFQESYAWSKYTKATDHLYSLSLNPPKYADVSDEYFIETINRAERRLGLVGQKQAQMLAEHKEMVRQEQAGKQVAINTKVDYSSQKHDYDWSFDIELDDKLNDFDFRKLDFDR